MSRYHTPVMASESIEFLALKPGGVYVDATLGAGGHALAMLKECPRIRLMAFDRDSEALAEARQNLNGCCDEIWGPGDPQPQGDPKTGIWGPGDPQPQDLGTWRSPTPESSTDQNLGTWRSPTPGPQIELIHAPFSSLRTQLALRKIGSIDGILFDLGVSSHQLDEASRGFSFDKDAPLDMRMDGAQELTAARLVNATEIRELSRVFREYGEEHQAARIARAIEKARAIEPLKSTSQLARVIESVAGTGSRESLKTKMRIFQALRIAVNGELLELISALNDAIMMLKPGGRVVVLSYHSLEDRIVKNSFRDAARGCMCPPRQIVCNCGLKPRLKILTGRPLSASAQETEANPRSRSAKLRAAEKLDSRLRGNDRDLIKKPDSRLRGNLRMEDRS